MSDFDSWEPQEPPRGFAEGVMKEIGGKPKRRTRAFAIGVGIAVAAAAASFIPGRLRTPHGDITADARIQRELGPRVIGVLEPGAHVKWTGDDLTQDSGDVFYRVEPGAPLVVHTPAGDVKVLGTCFRVKVEDMGNVKSALVGSAITAAAFVGVYEGKVAVSHAAESVEVGPGEAARASKDGVTKVAAETSSTDSDDPAMMANANLADQVHAYKQRLESIEAQKSKLEKQLGEAQDKLALQQSDGAPKKSEFDLSPEDWAQLSNDHRVKFRTPCSKPFNPKQEDLDKLGLAPQDGPVLKDAWVRSNARVWAGLKPLCTQAVGNADVAEKIGPDTCMHLIVDMADRADHEATHQAFADVGAIRAGLKPMPEHPSAALQTLMVMTGEMKSVETDIAKSLGPDEAHRILFGDGQGLCIWASNWGM
jgi:hypothetical protein